MTCWCTSSTAWAERPGEPLIQASPAALRRRGSRSFPTPIPGKTPIFPSACFRTCRVHGPETFKAVPLVCRRWHGLSQAPQLRRRLLIRLTTLALCEVPGCLARLRSLRAWVLHAPGHVRSLRLTAGPLDILSAAERREAEALLAAILASCGGSLRHLHLSVGPAADFSGWLPLAPQLRSVKLHNLLGPGIGAKPPSRLTAPWGGASLEHLALSDVVVAASPNGLLPPSLTSLELAVMQNFLAQVGGWFDQQHCLGSTAATGDHNELAQQAAFVR